MTSLGYVNVVATVVCWLAVAYKLPTLRHQYRDPTVRALCMAQLLLAAAQKCNGDFDGGEESLTTYRKLAGSLPNPERAQYREIQEIPRLTRPCTILPAKKG